MKANVRGVSETGHSDCDPGVCGGFSTRLSGTLEIRKLQRVDAELGLGVLGQVASKEEIRAMLRALHPGSPVADFVADDLMSDGTSFFPAMQLADGSLGHFVAIARCAATELRIAEESLCRHPAHMEAREKVQDRVTRLLWARLVTLRNRARAMAEDQRQTDPYLSLACGTLAGPYCGPMQRAAE